MPQFTSPGVFAEEIPRGPRPIEGVPTSIAAFIGRASGGPVNEPVAIPSFRDFEGTFGGLWLESTLGYAVRDFFANGGTQAVIVRLDRGGAVLEEADYTGPGKEAAGEGLYALEKARGFNLLAIPPHAAGRDLETGLVNAAAQYCERKRAVLLLDPPSAWKSAETAKSGMAGGPGTKSANAAIYFPRLMQPNPLRGNQVESFAPCGAVAGVIARMDAQRGVWKPPAGLEATLTGVSQLAVSLTAADLGDLNTLGVNCVRPLPPAGFVVWAARTLQGGQNPEWKYISVRRLALFIEESVSRGTQWAVFEPNAEPLWAQIRLTVGTFLESLWRKGALLGTKASEAFFVNCGKDTMTQDDIDNGRLTIVIGIAPVKPAEFVMIRIGQKAAAK